MEDQLRAELIAALTTHADQLRAAISGESARATALALDRPLQFEMDDLYFGVTLCNTETTILPGEWLDRVLPRDWFERAEQAQIDWNQLIVEEVFPWFAECWQSLGGSMSAAYLFLHLRPQEQYDLNGRRWWPRAK